MVCRVDSTFTFPVSDAVNPTMAVRERAAAVPCGPSALDCALAGDGALHAIAASVRKNRTSFRIAASYTPASGRAHAIWRRAARGARRRTPPSISDAHCAAGV
ncbi:hypothetical protein BE20_07570 [Sorangium cellulosum]|nr:hypothetical protein BE20_07570 [Sorangium cellulosum]